MSSHEIEYFRKCTIAAIRIQNLFRAKIKKNDNFSIVMKNHGIETPILEMFKYKRIPRIPRRSFFNDFCNLATDIIDLPQYKGLQLLLFLKIKIQPDGILIYFSEKIIEINVVFPSLKQSLLDYIRYVLPNTSILSTMKNSSPPLEEFIIQVKPIQFATDSFIGYHKDNSIYTGITYVDSIVSTEIAFDVDTIEFEWLECSPSFRFKTTDKLCTLGFYDKYVIHSEPIYEEENKEPREVNNFGSATATIDKDTIRFQDESVDYTFLRQDHRQKTQRHANPRKIIVFFVFPKEKRDMRIFKEEEFISEEALIGFQLYNYKTIIELSEKTVKEIKTAPSLLGFEFTGGKKKTIRKKSKRKSKTRRHHK